MTHRTRDLPGSKRHGPTQIEPARRRYQAMSSANVALGFSTARREETRLHLDGAKTGTRQHPLSPPSGGTTAGLLAGPVIPVVQRDLVKTNKDHPEGWVLTGGTCKIEIYFHSVGLHVRSDTTTNSNHKVTPVCQYQNS